ncbi:hypothetical protein DFJ73DRAFT_139604 [Zopfochytrium polystomum]|nr:hypothetical protein DFJ73DRAFT_139604 [Zopfochytrium polystomum]
MASRVEDELLKVQKAKEVIRVLRAELEDASGKQRADDRIHAVCRSCRSAAHALFDDGGDGGGKIRAVPGDGGGSTMRVERSIAEFEEILALKRECDTLRRSLEQERKSSVEQLVQRATEAEDRNASLETSSSKFSAELAEARSKLAASEQASRRLEDAVSGLRKRLEAYWCQHQRVDVLVREHFSREGASGDIAALLDGIAGVGAGGAGGGGGGAVGGGGPGFGFSGSRDESATDGILGTLLLHHPLDFESRVRGLAHAHRSSREHLAVLQLKVSELEHAVESRQARLADAQQAAHERGEAARRLEEELRVCRGALAAATEAAEDARRERERAEARVRKIASVGMAMFAGVGDGGGCGGLAVGMAGGGGVVKDLGASLSGSPAALPPSREPAVRGGQ